MTSFFENAKRHLSDKGRMLTFFGASGDLAHLEHLFVRHGFSANVVAHDSLSKDGWAVDYFTYRCEPR
jgi:release factor glutamine methyltransferase